jgi:urea transporter
LIAFGLSFPLNLVNAGIFGFNGVLCGIAFADEKRYPLLYATISIILSVFIVYGMTTLNLIALTAPFVFATWATLGLRKIAANQ